MNTVKIHGKTFLFEGEAIWRDEDGRDYHISDQRDVDALGLTKEIGYAVSSNYKTGDDVTFSIMPENAEQPYHFAAQVTAVHIYRSKTKYDLEIRVYGDSPTRIYNIDSRFVLSAV